MIPSRIVDLSYDSKGLWTILVRERKSDHPEVMRRITSVETIDELEARKLFEEEVKSLRNLKESK